MISSGGRGIEPQEGFHEPLRELVLPGHDLLVAALGVGLRRGQLQAIERALAGQWLAAVPHFQPILTRHIAFTDQGGQQWIGPQLVVIVQVFVAQSQGKHALLDQFQRGMLDQLRIAEIVEAAGQVGEQTRLSLYLP